MPYQVTNYHSKKALTKAVLSGKKVKIFPIPLSKEQEKQNLASLSAGNEPPNKIYPPLAYVEYEIFCSKNKEVPIWEAIVCLDVDCNIAKVI